MRTIIIYSSKHGATREAAKLLAHQLADGAVIAEVTEAPDVTPFDCVVLGSAIYAGKPLKPMQDFCAQHQEELLQKRLGLFICAMADPVIVRQELTMAYSALLRQHAVATAWFGGKIIPAKLSATERAVLKIMRKSKPREELRHDDIQRFVITLQAT